MSGDYFKEALVCHKAGHHDHAALLYREAIAANPRYAPAWSNLATINGYHRQYEVALAVSMIAHRLEPDNPVYLGNVGKNLWSLQRYEEAEEWTHRALRHGGSVEATAKFYHNLGASYFCRGRDRDAVDHFTRALELEPGRFDSEWDRAWAYMATGDYDRGLEAYELRWQRLPKNAIWDSGIPEWKGEYLSGKHILVHHEQGYGDTLQFIRFALVIARLFNTRLTVAAPTALYRLMKDQLDISEVAMLEGTWQAGTAYDPPIDYHSPVMSVWRWVRKLTDLSIGGSPYLTRPAPMPTARDPSRFAIGVVWAGAITPVLGSEHKSMDPTQLAPLAEIPGVALYSLQKSDEYEDLYHSGMLSLITDLAPRINDFFDLAQAMAAMDLVISVDTAPLHLAGAIGVPCIGLLPYARCWRWPRDDSETTPWYNSMTVLAQNKPGGWPGVIERAAREIVERMRA